MDTPDSNQFVPGQERGAQKDLKESVTLENVDDAEDLFLVAKEKLLDVNNWHKVAEGSSAAFILTDTHGSEVHRPAHTGDYIKIKIPGPANSAGDGFDWVHIEKIFNQVTPLGKEPVPNPIRDASGNVDEGKLKGAEEETGKQPAEENNKPKTPAPKKKGKG